MASLRTQEMENAYKKHRQENPTTSCPLCDKAPIKFFSHWKVTVNDFPYDVIAKTHHMILPIRHVREEGLTDEERAEFSSIKENFINPAYDYIVEPTLQEKSLPDHFHLHLIVGK